MNEIIAIFSTVFNMLSQGLEIINKNRSEKFMVQVEDYNIETELKIIVSTVSIVNLNDKPYHIKHVNLIINNDMIINHSFIDEVKVHDKEHLMLTTKYDHFVVNVPKCQLIDQMPYHPYIQQNQMAYGLILFDLRNMPKSINDIKLQIIVAGITANNSSTPGYSKVSTLFSLFGRLLVSL